MKTYEVEITRNSWSTRTFKVRAESEEDAESTALEKAKNSKFKEEDCEYIATEIKQEH